jgi:hypothetical protein
MDQIERIQITEVCEEFDMFGFPKNSNMIALKIKEFFSKTNSYVHIKKILIYTCKNKDNKYSVYAFLDVYWQDNDQAKNLQQILQNKNKEVKIQVIDKVIWYIKLVSKDINLYQHKHSSMTTYYYKNI